MTPPPAVLARLEQKWRDRCKASPENLAIGPDDARAIRQCADELATLRAGLAQQGEAKPVATVCLVGDRYGHGHFFEVQLQVAPGYAPKIGDAYFTHPAAVDADGQSAMWALRQILHDLPTRRDWLCPDVEKVARAIVARNPYADLTAALQPAATSDGEKS